MTRIEFSGSFADFEPKDIQKELSETGYEVPDIWAIAFDDFILQVGSDEEYCEMLADCLEQYEQFFSNEEQGFYLVINAGASISSERMRKYFTTWRQLKNRKCLLQWERQGLFNFDDFEFGPELSFQRNGNPSWGGVLRFSKRNISNALKINIFDKNSIFILGTKKDLLSRDYTKMLFEKFFSRSPQYLRYEFDFYSMYNWMDEGDFMMRFSFDGEEIRLSVVVKEKISDEKKASISKTINIDA